MLEKNGSLMLMISFKVKHTKQNENKVKTQ